MEAAVLALDKQGRYGASVIGFKEFTYVVWTSTTTARVETILPIK